MDHGEDFFFVIGAPRNVLTSLIFKTFDSVIPCFKSDQNFYFPGPCTTDFLQDSLDFSSFLDWMNFYMIHPFNLRV